MNMVHFVNTDINNWRPTLDGEDLQLRFAKDPTWQAIVFYGRRGYEKCNY